MVHEVILSEVKTPYPVSIEGLTRFKLDFCYNSGGAT